MYGGTFKYPKNLRDKGIRVMNNNLEMYNVFKAIRFKIVNGHFSTRRFFNQSQNIEKVIIYKN